MTSKEQFDNFISELFLKNKIDIKQKEQFCFLPYEKYEIEPQSNNFIIYEDWWIRRPEVVKSKIISILKISERVFARKCKVEKITKPVADAFLEENHIYGTTKSKVKYGLFYEDVLVGVATFAGQRQFHDGSRSVELLRYCNKNGFTIVGGLDKLLKSYIKNYKPDAIMTYVDLNWGSGEAFIKLGFKQKEEKQPMLFYINKNTGLRIQELNFNNSDENSYIKIKNKGSLKLILPVNT
ncbi:MAG: hypothetical protein GXO49_00820 [Chlorobi bacterium]|nr:hypothetical protein [Chlorobiota bacterium]